MHIKPHECRVLIDNLEFLQSLYGFGAKVVTSILKLSYLNVALFPAKALSSHPIASFADIFE